MLSRTAASSARYLCRPYAGTYGREIEIDSRSQWLFLRKGIQRDLYGKPSALNAKYRHPRVVVSGSMGLGDSIAEPYRLTLRAKGRELPQGWQVRFSP